MKNTIKGIIIGIIVTTFLFGTVFAAANTTTISTVLNNIGISINGSIKAKPGETYTLANGTKVPFSISYMGTTYLPLRKVAELLNKDVNFIGSENRAYITDAPGSDKAAPIVYTYDITYDANATPIIGVNIINLTNKKIKNIDLNFYMFDKDLKPVINTEGLNIGFCGLGDDTVIEARENADFEWEFPEFKRTERLGAQLLTVYYEDGTTWDVNE